MAKTTKAKATEVNDEVKATAPAESTYSRKELAENHKIFNASYAIVEVALLLAGKETFTLTEAKTIVEKFKNKEVK